MSSEEGTVPTTDQPGEDSALDRAAEQGPLAEPIDDDAPGGGVDEDVRDSTEEAADAPLLNFDLRP